MRGAIGIGLLAGVVWATGACGGDAENTGGGGTGGSGASGTGGTATGGHGTGGTIGEGGCGFAGCGGGTVGTECSPASPCGAGLFCDYPDDKCGQGSPGTCELEPTACTEEDDPTCGCDGAIHVNPCFANGDGTDVANTGGCAPPQGSVACGAHFCDPSTTYCRISTSDVGGTPDSFGCLPLPASCGAAPDCACLANEPCASLCDVGADGGLSLTCPGG